MTDADTEPGPYDDLPGWARVAEMLLTLSAEWSDPDEPHGERQPADWTAVTVPDFLSTMYAALDRHRDGAPGEDPWAVMERVLAESRYFIPPGEVERRVAAMREARDRAVLLTPPGAGPEETVAAWWRWESLVHATPPDWDGAEAFAWARYRVEDVIDDGDAFQAVMVIDDLLGADGANPVSVGEMLLQPLLDDRGPEVAWYVQEHLMDDHTGWRQAAKTINVEDPAALPGLAEYLAD